MQFDALGTPWTRLARSLGDATAPKTMVVAIVGLEHMTRLVEQVRAGEHGGAVLLNAHGQSIATGHAVRATDAGRERALTHGLGSVSQRWAIYTNDVGVEQLGAAAPVTPFGWTLLIEQPTDEAFSAAAGFGVQLALAAVAALVLMAAAGTLFGRRLIAPVVTLEHATRSLAEGRFDVRVVPEGTDEVARLARSFNVMADRLSALQDRIKSQERQVMFGRVVAGLFHDLSHPIETIANSARLLLEPSIDLDERRAIGATIERERASLGRFLDDVLNVARPRPLDRVPVDVNACVAEAIDALRAEADKAGVTLAGHFASGTPTIAGDRFALGRVCRNLIANAVQATPPGGHVVLYTTQSDTDVEIEIADTGMGIPPDRLVTVFDDFVTTKKRGLGLGLATSRRIVEQLSGSIRASSEVGRGSTFTLHFPRHVRVAVEAAS